MEMDEYQNKAGETAIYPNRGENFLYPTLGLVGEAGEIANKIKKIERDNDGKVTEEVVEIVKSELGDILWYVSQLAVEFKLSLDEIAKFNLEKLQRRKIENKLKGSGDNR